MVMGQTAAASNERLPPHAMTTAARRRARGPEGGAATWLTRVPSSPACARMLALVSLLATLLLAVAILGFLVRNGVYIAPRCGRVRAGRGRRVVGHLQTAAAGACMASSGRCWVQLS